jgi:predicted nucleic acid-binding protein
VKIDEILPGIRTLFLDTAPVIYWVEQNPQYFPIVSVIFDRILNSMLMAVTSPITLAECLVHPYALNQTELQRNFINLIVNTENITFKTIDTSMLAIRAKYNLQLPDAFQIAVALNAECEAFLTNDTAFRRVTELQILILNELTI